MGKMYFLFCNTAQVSNDLVSSSSSVSQFRQYYCYIGGIFMQLNCHLREESVFESENIPATFFGKELYLFERIEVDIGEVGKLASISICRGQG